MTVSTLIYAVQLRLADLLPRCLFFMNIEVIHALELAPRRGKVPEAPVEEGDHARWAGTADLAALVAFGADASELQARFARGARVAILERQGRVIAWNWFELDGHDYYDWLRYTLSSGEIWGFDGRVDPAHRGQGCFARVRGFAARELAAEGYRRIVNMIDLLNRSSLRARAKTGSREIGRVFWLRLPGTTLVWQGGALRMDSWGPARRLQLSTTDLECGVRR